MPGHGSQRLWMSSVMGDALIESNDVALGPILLMHADHIGCLKVGPFQIVVDVRPQPPEPNFASAGVDARRCASVPCKVFCIGEAVDVSDLEQDDHAQDESHPWERHEELERWSRLEDLPHPIFELANVRADLVELFQQLLGREARMSGRRTGIGKRWHGLTAANGRRRGRLGRVCRRLVPTAMDPAPGPDRHADRGHLLRVYGVVGSTAGGRLGDNCSHIPFSASTKRSGAGH